MNTKANQNIPKSFVNSQKYEIFSEGGEELDSNLRKLVDDGIGEKESILMEETADVAAAWRAEDRPSEKCFSYGGKWF